MTRLFDGPGPRVFAVPPGADFARVLAAGTRARLGGAPPEALARVSILLNTRRARRAVEAAFEAEGGAATWLPRLATLEAVGAVDPGLPPAVDPARRRLRLTRLVAALLQRRPDLGPQAAAPALAAALERLLDEMQREGVPLDALDGAAPVEHARRWETTLDFLAILREVWPGVLAADEDGAVDPETRRRAAVERLAARWEAAPPEGPVIAAGSTGSQATTALLLQAVSRAPQGAIVLPGFDPALAADIWAEIGPEHPWFGFRRLLGALDRAPEAVPFWTEGPFARPARRRLLAEALRPAPVTDAWRAARPALAAEAAAATEGVALLEAPDPRREADAIALALRAALETPGRRAALVTPDRTLARRVAAALARWGIEPDDSGGRPLALTPPGVFLKLVASLGFGAYDPVALLGLLKHPLADPERDRGAWLGAVRRFELRVLRRMPEIAALEAAADAWSRARDPERPDPLGPALARLAALAAPDEAPLETLAATHLDAAAALAPGLWDKKAGEAARDAAEAFRDAAAVYGPCPPAFYPTLFAAALEGEAREEAFRPDSRIAIWGPLEARMQSADLVVLGGLNEGVWPERPSPDPWLSRPMRDRLGLPSPERRIGLAAHDWLQAASGPEVLLGRALRDDGAPTTPSRWLARLTTLLGGVDSGALDAMRARGARWTALVDPVARPEDGAAPAPRPAPRPPVEARPRAISATEVQTLIRDPYAVYARRILRLSPLDPIAREIDARDRGMALHAVMKRFAEATTENPAPDAAALLAAFDAEMAGAHVPEALRRLWRARLARLAPVFLAEEAARRRLGRSVGLEVKGRREGVGFALKARADRIDRRADGALALYDYKTGAPPSEKQIALFDKQLPLEAAIAEAGGFEGVEPARVAVLGHISLGGGKGAGAEAPVEAEPGALAAEAWEGLAALLAAYARPETPYLARARPAQLSYASDYDHLSRHGEWEDGGSDDR